MSWQYTSVTTYHCLNLLLIVSWCICTIECIATQFNCFGPLSSHFTFICAPPMHPSSASTHLFVFSQDPNPCLKISMSGQYLAGNFHLIQARCPFKMSTPILHLSVDFILYLCDANAGPGLVMQQSTPLMLREQLLFALVPGDYLSCYQKQH